MAQNNQGRTPYEQYARIFGALEEHLEALERGGAHKAGAHLDAAIHQLRRDHSALKKASAGHMSSPTQKASKAEKTAILAGFSTSFSDPLGRSQVFPRKAKPANSR